MGVTSLCDVKKYTVIDGLNTIVHWVTYSSLRKFQNDTIGYFDSIMIRFAIVNSRKYNILDTAYKFNSKHFQRTKYLVKHSINTSTNYYPNILTYPLHDIRQDSWSSNTHWSFIRVPMIDLIEQSCEGFTL